VTDPVWLNVSEVELITKKLGISDELEEFIREKTLYPEKFSINEETSVEDDLGVTGDDSSVFMEAFFEKFNVEPGDFDCSRYFEGEGIFNPFFAIGRLIFRKTEQERARTSLTIGMLQGAVDLGFWDSQRLTDWNNRRSKDAR
jgi:hypothetical protein